MHQLSFESYLNELDQPFAGWDFSYLTSSSRMHEFPLPWNYFNIVKTYLVEADSLLDMGTGGGEFLSSLAPLPSITYATESYEPNIELARNNLESFGIKVIPIQDDNNLPVEKNFFQLIINRHESFKSPEIKRILKPNGVFITQQVGEMNDYELNKVLGGSGK